MASTKKNAQETLAAGPNANQAAGFDWAAWLPEDIKTTDLKKTGLLTPIYVMERAVDGGWPPVFGKMDRIIALPTQKMGTSQEWTPRMIVVVSEIPTKGIAGSGEQETEVDIKPGDRILIPVSGNLRVNRELLLAAVDEDRVWRAGFRVLPDMQETAKGDMWVWDAQLASATKAIKREGEFAFPQAVDKNLLLSEWNSKGSAANGAAPSTPGEVIGKDGKPVKSVVGAQA